MDPTVRASKGVPFSSTQRIGLNVVVTKRDDKAIVTRTKVDADIAQANGVFAPDVEFYVATFEENGAIATDVSNSVGSDKIFDPKPTLPLLYVVSYTDGGGVAWSNGNGIVVALNGAHAIVAHELAHAVGLSHTYNADDFVDDTGFAPTTCTFSPECSSPSTCDSCRYASCPDASTNPSPDPQNIMAWARGQRCNLKMTPGQRQLVRCTMRTSQKRLIATPPCSCPTGFSCVGTSCVCQRRLCGNQCVSLGTDQNCRKCGDVCTNGTRCQGSPRACVDPPLCPEGTRECGLDCNGNQVCIPKNKPGGCPNFPCN